MYMSVALTLNISGEILVMCFTPESSVCTQRGICNYNHISEGEIY